MSKCTNCGCNLVGTPESHVPDGLCNTCERDRLRHEYTGLQTRVDALQRENEQLGRDLDNERVGHGAAFDACCQARSRLAEVQAVADRLQRERGVLAAAVRARGKRSDAYIDRDVNPQAYVDAANRDGYAYQAALTLLQGEQPNVQERELESGKVTIPTVCPWDHHDALPDHYHGPCEPGKMPHCNPTCPGPMQPTEGAVVRGDKPDPPEAKHPPTTLQSSYVIDRMAVNSMHPIAIDTMLEDRILMLRSLFGQVRREYPLAESYVLTVSVQAVPPSGPSSPA